MGKDRTGIIAALILTCLGATREQLLVDYVRSDAYHAVALGGLEKDKRLAGVDWDVFARAPATAMRCTLAWVSGKYGSVEGYMDDIGASPVIARIAWDMQGCVGRSPRETVTMLPI